MTHTLVVGGTRGIGRAVVRRFVGDGGRVSLVGRREPPEATHPNVRLWQVDVRDDTALRAALADIVESAGSVSNAVLLQRYRGDGDPWDGELEVSLGAARTILDMAGDLCEAEGGSVVVVGSNASRLVAWEQPAAYHAAKAALRQLVRYYAVRLGPRRIRVNSVAPGAVLKEETRDLYLADAFAARVAEETPLGRIGTAEDVAAAVALLCGSDAAFVTGQEIVVDGGLSLLWQESLLRRFAGGDA